MGGSYEGLVGGSARTFSSAGLSSVAVWYTADRTVFEKGGSAGDFWVVQQTEGEKEWLRRPPCGKRMLEARL